MERRNFIKNLGYFYLYSTTVSILVQGCTNSLYYSKFILSGNIISINKIEFINSDDGTERKFLLVKSDTAKYPICIYKFGEDDYTALLMQCTHKGCELNPNDRFISCPCHGSEFDNKGNVQQPPADKNLFTFKVYTDNENIYVHL